MDFPINQFILVSAHIILFTDLSKCVSHERNINNGIVDASDGEFPYAVFVQTRLVFKTVPLVVGCTGALISASWIILASHCVDGVHSSYQIKIAAGNIQMAKCFPQSWLLTSESYGSDVVGCESLQIRESREAYLENGKRSDNNNENAFDVACCKTSEPFDLSRPNIGTVPLLSRYWPQEKWFGFRCVAYGYGPMIIGNYPTDKWPGVLRKVRVVASVTGPACPCGYTEMSKQPDNFYATVLLCLQNSGTCPEDMGGMLICNGIAVGVAFKYIDATSCQLTSEEDCLAKTPVYQYFPPYRQLFHHNGVEFTEAVEPNLAANYSAAHLCVVIVTCLVVIAVAE